MIPCLLALAFVALGCASTDPPASHEWRYYGADSGSQRFSSLDQIDSTNVADLRVVWQWRAPDWDVRERHSMLQGWGQNEGTPLMVDGV